MPCVCSILYPHADELLTTFERYNREINDIFKNTARVTTFGRTQTRWSRWLNGEYADVSRPQSHERSILSGLSFYRIILCLRFAMAERINSTTYPFPTAQRQLYRKALQHAVKNGEHNTEYIAYLVRNDFRLHPNACLGAAYAAPTEPPMFCLGYRFPQLSATAAVSAA